MVRMSDSRLSDVPPNVQHNFDGDVKVLNATSETRAALRAGLTQLAQELQRHEKKPTGVIGEITIKVGGRPPKLHKYNISITTSTFNTLDFERQIPAREKPSETSSATNEQPQGSVIVYSNGQQPDPNQSSTKVGSHSLENDDEFREDRNSKRLRLEAPKATPRTKEYTSSETQSQEVPTKAKDSDRIDQLLKFLENWHNEWVHQGGWLFDNITKAHGVSDSTRTELENKMEAVQDILGQALNAAGQGLMTELVGVSKGIPWLEQCRKTSDDQMQAREEKWRTSSATFHDQTRRDREAAEKRIEQRLEAQGELLLKLARANGIEPDSQDLSREGSLGAQLTRELNNEVAKSGTGSKRAAQRESVIDVDDSS